MRACYCLNVLVDAKEDFKEVKTESLNLTEEEKNHPFFKQELLLVNKLGGIKKVHPGLVRVKQIGSWFIYDCLNCSVHTHAIHKDLQESFVLIYAKLLGSKAIANIQTSDLYSTIFNVVVNPIGIGLDLNADPLSFPNSSTEEITETIKNFDRITKDYLTKEYSATEERIKNYQLQEMQKLEVIKERSHTEHENLLKVLLHAVQNDQSLANPPHSPMKNFTDEGLDYTGTPDEIFEISSRIGLSGNETKRQKGSLGKRIKKRRPRNDDLQFFYEDGSGSESLTGSSESLENFGNWDADRKISKAGANFDSEEEVTVSQAGGVSIAQKKRQLSVAKSLPININFSTQMAARLHSDEDFDNAPVGENVDIAANIKALAKSVHGDAVFGELPKPRFSTQI